MLCGLGIARSSLSLLTQLLRLLPASLFLTHHATSPQLAAVVAMLVARAGDEGDEMRHLVRVIKDPSVRGGLRYVDPSDGEDLTRYGTECTEKPRTARHSTGSAAGGAVDEVRRLEYEVFYDGLSNPKANDEVQNAERAEAVVGLLKLVVREDLQREGDWGEDWYKLRDSHYSRKALLRPEDSAGHGWTSCVVRLPSEGPFQAVEVSHAALRTWQHSSCSL